MSLAHWDKSTTALQTLRAIQAKRQHATPVHKLHHQAFKCRDAEETRKFYEEVLQMLSAGKHLGCLSLEKADNRLDITCQLSNAAVTRGTGGLFVYAPGDWRGDGLDLGVAVNLSAMDLMDADLPDFIHDCQRRHKVPPAKIILEVTEGALMRDVDYAVRMLHRLRAGGVRLSIDDFGTGYSSLSYLQRLPAQIIKIDQSFVRDMLDNPRDRALVQGIVGLALAFGRDAVAEGVESAAHAVLLGDMGCDILQGYGVARPMPADALPAWAAQWALPAAFVRVTEQRERVQ